MFILRMLGKHFEWGFWCVWLGLGHSRPGGIAQSPSTRVALPARRRREHNRHFTSAAFSITAATSFAWTTREAWLPATSVIRAFIPAANIF